MQEYGSFCPVSKAAEVLCERWSILVVRELLHGRSRFVELRRGLPGCPPATLSKRLKQLEQTGVVDRFDDGASVSYELTEAGRELFPLVQAMGEWGQRWVRSSYPDDEMDPDELLWDVRRFLEPDGLGRTPATVRMDVELPAGGRKTYWLVAEPGGVDVCDVDPRRDVDVHVAAHVRTLVQVWMGDTTFQRAQRDGLVTAEGPRAMTRRLPGWFGQHPILAPVEARAPAG